MTMTVHLRSHSFARYKHICDILQYKNKSIMQLKRQFQFQFLVTESVVTYLYVPISMIYRHICHHFAYSTQSPIRYLLTQKKIVNIIGP
jgi:hypothetical protein